MSTDTLEHYLTHSYEPDCDYVDGSIEDRNTGTRTHAALQVRVGSYLLSTYERYGMEVFIAVRIRVSATRVRIPDVCATVGDPGEEVFTKPPFLCVEILSAEDRMRRFEVRIQDYLAMGVPYVWVLDPATRQAYVSTAADGLREVKDGVLRASDPTLEMPLGGLWG